MVCVKSFANVICAVADFTLEQRDSLRVFILCDKNCWLNHVLKHLLLRLENGP